MGELCDKCDKIQCWFNQRERESDRERRVHISTVTCCTTIANMDCGRWDFGDNNNNSNENITRKMNIIIVRGGTIISYPLSCYPSIYLPLRAFVALPFCCIQSPLFLFPVASCELLFPTQSDCSQLKALVFVHLIPDVIRVMWG